MWTQVCGNRYTPVSTDLYTHVLQLMTCLVYKVHRYVCIPLYTSVHVKTSIWHAMYTCYTCISLYTSVHVKTSIWHAMYTCYTCISLYTSVYVKISIWYAMYPYSYQVISGASTSQAQVIFSVGAEKQVLQQNKLEKKNWCFNHLQILCLCS